MKTLELKECDYLFETLDELVDMLKDEYEVTLHIRKKGKFKKEVVKL